MKFLWNRPRKHPKCDGHAATSFPDSNYWTDVILAWLCYSGVYLTKKHAEVSYNYLYDFFDITVIDDKNNPNNVKYMDRYLEASGLCFSKTGAFRWREPVEEGDKRECDNGARYFVYAEDVHGRKFPGEEDKPGKNINQYLGRSRIVLNGVVIDCSPEIGKCNQPEDFNNRIVGYFWNSLLEAIFAPDKFVFNGCGGKMAARDWLKFHEQRLGVPIVGTLERYKQGDVKYAEIVIIPSMEHYP